MAISLVHPNERHTGIVCLLVKYLLWQCATFGKHNYFDLFSNSWCKHFEQHTMNLSLEHFKEQHTGIWCLLVKYLLWQCAMWTTFGKHNYFDRFSNSWCNHFEQNATNLSVEHFKEQHTRIWYLLSKFLFGQCAIWTNFRNHNFSGRFLNSSCKPFAQGAMDVFLEYPKE